MKINNGKVVSFHYTLKDNEGQVLDQSGDNPLFYLHGHKNIIPGLESALEGKGANDELTVTVQPKDAYGEIEPQLVQDIPRAEFPDNESLEVGMQFQMDTPNGPAIIMVKNLTDSVITVDGNHPLAGTTLNFEVKVANVREASAEELEHGHVHGEGGVEH